MLKLFSTLAAMSFSLSAMGETFTYKNYTLDRDANIVYGGGLEWLQWDKTVGFSAMDALAVYRADGWRLATNQEMADLFNSFDLNGVFDADENSGLKTQLKTPRNSYDEANYFIELFGDTYRAAGFTYNSIDPVEYSGAVYGSDEDGNGKLKSAEVMDEYFHEGGYDVWGVAYISSDTLLPDRVADPRGIALVREISQVPLPSTFSLYLMAIFGLIGIGGRKRFIK